MWEKFDKNIRVIQRTTTRSASESVSNEIKIILNAFVLSLQFSSEKYASFEYGTINRKIQLCIFASFFNDFQDWAQIIWRCRARVTCNVMCSCKSFCRKRSRYETHFNKNLNEENAMHEMTIAENGPSIFKANSVLFAAMNDYWNTNSKKGSWHFIRESNTNIKDYGTSYGKTTLKIMKQQSKFPVMDMWIKWLYNKVYKYTFKLIVMMIVEVIILLLLLVSFEYC